jgi:citrate lyase gamma subunit
MPLPTINTPTYSLILPSTEKEVQYRPFLVKEEKLLLLALESEDQKQITTAIKTVIENCLKTKGIKVQTLPTFDIEYLFLNIRSKSIGEEVEVNLLCPDDGETTVAVKINIDDIQVEKNPEHTKTIKIDDNIMMEMKYPSLDQFIKSNFDFSGSNVMEQSFDLVVDCIDKIYTEEETFAAGDVSKKELTEFLESMNSVQFKKIETFFTTMPKLSHTIKLKNPNTNVESEVVLEGLSDFFG